MAVRIFLALFAAASAVLHSSAATTYQVGDNFGWATPSGGFSFSNWAAQRTFVLDDVLVFQFTTGQHTAARVNQDDYNNCNTRGNPISIQTNGPARFTLNQLGPWHFICTESNHCSLGQKLFVNVTSAAGSPTGSPSPGSSPTTPSGSNTPPPPPPNSANMPTTTAAPLIFLLIAMAFLF